jgi:hypothetical protein
MTVVSGDVYRITLPNIVIVLRSLSDVVLNWNEGTWNEGTYIRSLEAVEKSIKALYKTKSGKEPPYIHQLIPKGWYDFTLRVSIKLCLMGYNGYSTLEQGTVCPGS